MAYFFLTLALVYLLIDVGYIVYNSFKLYSFQGSDAISASLCSALLIWHFPIVSTFLFFVNYFFFIFWLFQKAYVLIA
ncbi:hypothetical protein NIES4106_50130 [Fischerella sp. NIES-4106]|jgi:hypothetical protein|nr:hypothetical protein NIES4106_50130 [Fischerella sp. NIES-4106]